MPPSISEASSPPDESVFRRWMCLPPRLPEPGYPEQTGEFELAELLTKLRRYGRASSTAQGLEAVRIPAGGRALSRKETADARRKRVVKSEKIIGGEALTPRRRQDGSSRTRLGRRANSELGVPSLATRRFDFHLGGVTNRGNFFSDQRNVVIDLWTPAGRNASECQADNGRENHPRSYEDYDYHASVKARNVPNSLALRAAFEPEGGKCGRSVKSKTPSLTGWCLKTTQASG